MPSSFCECGNPATIKKGKNLICARCAGIEARLWEFHDPEMQDENGRKVIRDGKKKERPE